MQFLDLPDDGFSDFQAVNTARRNRNRYLAKFLHRPPTFALNTATAVRKLLGMKRLKLAQRLRAINEVARSSQSQMSDEFRQEIQHALSKDEKLLGEMLNRYRL